MIPRDALLRGARRLASRANPRIKDWSGLADRAERERLGLTLAEGAKLAGEALAAPAGGVFRPVALLISDAGADRAEAGDLFALAGEMGIERYSLSDDCFSKVSGLKNADGLSVVLSFSRESPDFSPIFLLPDSRWLVAAEVQDPGNAGALARTALAAGFSGCLFLGGADPASPKFLRGGMGAAFRLPCLCAGLDAFVSAWKAGSGQASLVIADARPDSGDYRTLEYRPPLLLVIGGERGVPAELAGLPGRRAHIPLSGGVESLNLAVAAGIIMFEAMRGKQGRP